MEKRKVYSICYIFLLTMTGPALCLQHEAEDNLESRQKRQVAIGPIAAYAGMAVSPWVWAALLAAYGFMALRQYSISRRESSGYSIPCANNRGWCRPQCFSHEYIDVGNSYICGGNDCCRPGNI